MKRKIKINNNWTIETSKDYYYDLLVGTLVGTDNVYHINEDTYDVYTNLKKALKDCTYLKRQAIKDYKNGCYVKGYKPVVTLIKMFIEEDGSVCEDYCEMQAEWVLGERKW